MPTLLEMPQSSVRQVPMEAMSTSTEQGWHAGQLLGSFPAHWRTHVHPVPASPDMLQRPVQPVLVEVEARSQQPGAQPVAHGLDGLPPWAPNQAQVQAIIKASLVFICVDTWWKPLSPQPQAQLDI